MDLDYNNGGDQRRGRKRKNASRDEENDRRTRREEKRRKQEEREEQARQEREIQNRRIFIEFGTAHLMNGVYIGQPIERYVTLSTAEQSELLNGEWDSFQEEDRTYFGPEMSNLLDLQRLLDEACSTVDTCRAKWIDLAEKDTNWLKYLDLYDTALHDAIIACDNFTELVVELIDWYNNKPNSVFLENLRWHNDLWRGKRFTMYADMLIFRREKLYPAKRKTPGRKQDDGAVPEEEFDEYKDRSEARATIIPTLPPIIFPLGDMAAVHWTCVDRIGQVGGQNIGVDILLGVDASGRIVERKVRKHISMVDEWKTPKFWHGDFEGDPDELYPREYLAQRLMSQKEARFVVKAVGRPRYDGIDEVVQIYMEYALHGDLDDALRLHQAVNTKMPEAFLWLLLQALVETVYIMKYGYLKDGQKKPQNWLEIVHRDLKPGNVFLDQRDPGHFPMYPRPKVADYGLCLLTNADDPCNPKVTTGGGTPGYQPPETIRFIDPVNEKRVDDHNQILSPCNVWGIGAILYALMTLQSLDDAPPPEHQLPYCTTATAPDFGPFTYAVAGDVTKKWGAGAYTKPLIDIVQTCLDFDPEKRGSIETWKETIKDQINRYPYYRLNAGQRVGDDVTPKLRTLEERAAYRDQMVCPPVWRDSEGNVVEV